MYKRQGYVPREIRSLRLVAADDELDYHLKYADRSALARLLQRRDDCDEILIVRDGAITDTSYSNVAFFDGRKYVTPDTFLLNGMRRQYLLGTGVLTECRITPSDRAVSSGSCSSMPCWESRTTSPFRSNGFGDYNRR